VLHPDARRHRLDDQIHQFLGLGILVPRLVLLAVLRGALSEQASRPAAAANTSATTATATTTATPAAPTTTATTRATTIVGVRPIRLRWLNIRRRLYQQVLNRINHRIHLVVGNFRRSDFDDTVIDVESQSHAT